ncbi:MAG: WD40 repeat domain-containing protein [Chloroflexaceae bacterium]|nr:WD40 repeat domain-containing protein [Chloroflexaceae bacterium]
MYQPRFIARLLLAVCLGGLAVWGFIVSQRDPALIGVMDIGSDVVSVSFSSNSQLLAASSRQGVWLWRLAYNEQAVRIVQEIQLSTTYANAVAFHPSGQILATADADAIIRLRNVQTGRAIATIPFDTGPYDDTIYDMQFSSDGVFLAVANKYGMITVWSVQDQTVRYQLKGHQRTRIDTSSFDLAEHVLGIAVHPDRSMLASVGEDTTVHLWSLHDGSLIRVLRSRPEHRSILHAVAFTTDGQYVVASGTRGAPQVWAIEQELPAKEFLPKEDTMVALAVHPNGELIATGPQMRGRYPAFRWVGPDDNRIVLWRMTEQEPHAYLTGYFKETYALAFSPNGLLLASGSEDGGVRLWSVVEFEE